MEEREKAKICLCKPHIHKHTQTHRLNNTFESAECTGSQTLCHQISWAVESGRNLRSQITHEKHVFRISTENISLYKHSPVMFSLTRHHHCLIGTTSVKHFQTMGKESNRMQLNHLKMIFEGKNWINFLIFYIFVIFLYIYILYYTVLYCS